jgi:hypothetical protein
LREDVSQRAAALQEWVVSLGADIHPGVVIMPEGGLRTTADLPTGAVIASIPAGAIMMQEAALDLFVATYPAAQLSRESLRARLSGHAFLAAQLLAERSDGAHSPYIDMLPSDMGHIPFTFPPRGESEELLKGSQIPEQAARRREEVRTEYKVLCQVSGEFQRLFTLSDYSWALANVASRAFSHQPTGLRGAAEGEVRHASLVTRHWSLVTRHSVAGGLGARCR